jgi:hypothetical protein
MELLEEPDMEDIVEASLGRQGQANGDIVDELDHAVRPVKPWLQLADCRLGHRGRRALTKTQQHPLTFLVVDRTVELIVVALLHHLGLLEPVMDVLEELRVLLQSPSHRRYPRRPVLV